MSTGFTLFNVWFGVIFALIISTIAFNIYTGVNAEAGSISFGINGLTESRCIDGYKFIVGQDGSARQIMDELGRGAKCTQVVK